MNRASRQAQREAKRSFPVRVKIAVPPEGLGRQLVLMHAWLDESCGVDGWASALAGTTGVANDAIAFYFENTDFARAFVARFCCGYRLGTSTGSLTTPRDVRQGAAGCKTP
jgi:hypothetical protein